MDVKEQALRQIKEQALRQIMNAAIDLENDEEKSREVVAQDIQKIVLAALDGRWRQTEVMTKCKMCRERSKTWEGGDPKCAFPDDTPFGDNWNCATVNAIRNILGNGQHEDRNRRVDYRTLIGGDQQYALIEISDIDLPSGDAYALWVTWYKSRGRTEGMWIVGQQPPRLPTEADLLAIIAECSDR